MGIISLHFRTFVHATEDEEKVRSAMRFVSELDEMERNVTTGHHGNEIIILEGHITDKKRSKLFFPRLSLEDLKLLLDTLERRVDDDCFLFLRLDKQKAHMERLELTTSDDAIAVRAKLESYPKKREIACNMAQEFLTDLIERAERKNVN